GITGAIVRRQPFGGCKASSFGSGAKAGGPNYVAQFAKAESVALPSENGHLSTALIPLIASLHSYGLDEQAETIWKKSAASYAYWAPIFKEPTDSAPVIGQDNYFYHVPIPVSLRCETPVNLPLLQIIAACIACQSPLEISSSQALNLPFLPGVTIAVESEADLLQRKPRRIRLLAPPTPTLKQTAADLSII